MLNVEHDRENVKALLTSLRICHCKAIISQIYGMSNPVLYLGSNREPNTHTHTHTPLEGISMRQSNQKDLELCYRMLPMQIIAL